MFDAVRMLKSTLWSHLLSFSLSLKHLKSEFLLLLSPFFFCCVCKSHEGVKEWRRSFSNKSAGFQSSTDICKHGKPTQKSWCFIPGSGYLNCGIWMLSFSWPVKPRSCSRCVTVQWGLLTSCLLLISVSMGQCSFGLWAYLSGAASLKWKSVPVSQCWTGVGALNAGNLDLSPLAAFPSLFSLIFFHVVKSAHISSNLSVFSLNEPPPLSLYQTLRKSCSVKHQPRDQCASVEFRLQQHGRVIVCCSLKAAHFTDT